eukprot:symbB.v1.2.026378.t1/scaffold2630.1/size74437/4
MPDAEAICIDSEEEAVAPPKRRRKFGQFQVTSQAIPAISCIDLDEEEKPEKKSDEAHAHSAKAADLTTVCLSSDEEAPSLSEVKRPPKKATTKEVRSEENGIDTDGLEARAQELAEAALRSLPATVRASRIPKVKHSILVRLRSQAALGPVPEAETPTPQPVVPPQPPPPPEPSELSQQKQELQEWVEKNQQQIQHHLQVEQQRQEGERYRLAEREKRKALWNTGTSEALPNEREDGRLTANGWESRHFQSDKERLKFLRLMGGQKFVDAATSMEGELDDEKVFELIRGEWVEAKEDEEEEDFNIREDAATVELLAGQWVDVQMESKEPDLEESVCAERQQDLEKQYLEGMSRQLGARRLGLGA